MMKTTIAAALALVVASGAAMAEFKDFTVNGDLVTKGQQEAVATEAISNNPNPHAAIANPQIEDQVRQMVIEYKVMSQYAKKEGLDKQQAVKDDIERITDMVLMKHAVNEYVKKNPVTEKELKDEYQKESDRWGKTEYRVRHILVKTRTKPSRSLIRSIRVHPLRRSLLKSLWTKKARTAAAFSIGPLLRSLPASSRAPSWASRRAKWIRFRCSRRLVSMW